MIGLFTVHYFDPRDGVLNMEAFRVLARNAQEAIKKAEKYKSVKRYRVESVDCIGFSEQ